MGVLEGKSKEFLLSPSFYEEKDLHEEIAEVARSSFKTRSPPEISASGYVVRTLEAVLWGFYHTDSFYDGLVQVVNLGDDADTVGSFPYLTRNPQGRSTGNSLELFMPITHRKEFLNE